MLLDKRIEKDCVTDWCPGCRHNGVLGNSHICKKCFILTNSETVIGPSNYIPIDAEDNNGENYDQT